MKKYLLGSIAVIMAIGLFSFTKVRTTSATTYAFVYNSTDYSPSGVSNPANWIQSTPSCTSGSDYPCTITVDGAYVNSDGSLNSSTKINTIQGSIANDYIVRSGGNVESFENRQ